MPELVRVKFANGTEGVVGRDWIDRWPEDIAEELGPDDGTPVAPQKPKRPAAKKPASKPRQTRSSAKKPAPEVPESNNSSVDEQKESA